MQPKNIKNLGERKSIVVRTMMNINCGINIDNKTKEQHMGIRNINVSSLGTKRNNATQRKSLFLDGWFRFIYIFSSTAI